MTFLLFLNCLFKRYKSVLTNEVIILGTKQILCLYVNYCGLMDAWFYSSAQFWDKDLDLYVVLKAINNSHYPTVNQDVKSV